MTFRVIDTTTGHAPDLAIIALNEDWARGLIYCDMEGFAITEDGGLILLDECGNYAYCPEGRFEVVMKEEGVDLMSNSPLPRLRDMLCRCCWNDCDCGCIDTCPVHKSHQTHFGRSSPYTGTVFQAQGRCFNKVQPHCPLPSVPHEGGEG